MDLDCEDFHSEVHICVYSQMERVQEGKYIAKEQWIHWDAESIANLAASSDSNCSDDTILYDLDSEMSSQNDNNDVVDNCLLPDINQLIAELTPIAWQTNPSACPPHNFVMPTNYSPATSVYSPRSPSYSLRHSPINIDSDSEDSEHGFTPPQNDGPITTRAKKIFTLPNDDSDLEYDGEVELIGLVGNYVNRHKMPIQINGVYIFP